LQEYTCLNVLENSHPTENNEEYHCPCEFEKQIALADLAICNCRYGNIIEVSMKGAKDTGDKTIVHSLNKFKKNLNFWIE